MGDTLDLSNMDIDWVTKAPEPDAPKQPASPKDAKIQAANAAVRNSIKSIPEDTTLGESPTDLFTAGMGEAVTEPYYGIKDKLALLGKPKGSAGDDLVRKLNAERADRERTNKMLYSNVPANLGRFAGKALPAMLFPAELPAQIALEGVTDFLSPSGHKTDSALGEFSGSGLNALEGIGTMYGTGKVLQGLGKGYAALKGNYTKAGDEAMAINEAAKRLGLDNISIGQLAPWSRKFFGERNLSSYPEKVIKQGEQLANKTGGEIVPGIYDVGANYLDKLRSAINTRFNLGKQKYAAVDDHIEANGLSGYKPKETMDVVLDKAHEGYKTAMTHLDDYGAGWLKDAPESFKNLNLRMSDYFDLRKSTNAALNRVTELAKNTGKEKFLSAKEYLSSLKSSLDNDANTWASKNADNKEAVNLFRDATNYWKNSVVPTVINNPLAQQLIKKSGGFSSGEEALKATMTGRGMPETNLLRPTMSQEGNDMVDVMRAFPDIYKTILTKGTIPEQGSLFSHLGSVKGVPVGALASLKARLPGVKNWNETEAAKRLFFAKNALEGTNAGRAAYGAAQIPQEMAYDTLRGLLDSK